MSGARVQIGTLAKRDGKHCHYCNVETTKTGRAAGTRDHIVPKSLGGVNHVDNYVLACIECNAIRGNELVYCHCEFCEKVIDDWFHDNIWSFTNPLRFKIFKDGPSKWVIVFNGKRTSHKSHVAAVKAMAGIKRSFIHNAEHGGMV